jgi:hypothetical protein
MFKFLAPTIFAIALPAAAEDLMEFRLAPDSAENNILRSVVNGGEYEIFASGDIDSGATERFLKFVHDKKIDDAVVIFDSPGGSLAEGVKLGKAIRAMRFNTAIGSYGQNGRRVYSGICASSCAYAFSGGVYRFYYGSEEKLGIHQFYLSGDNKGDIGDTQIVSSALIDYLQIMGIDPKAFVIASTARGDTMVWLTPEEATSLGLSNNGSDPTTAEIKMAGLNPYLKVEQSHSDVTARVLFGCNQGNVTISAGIVTTPELSRDKQSMLSRSYLETPEAGELLVKIGNSGATAVDSVLWLDRTLNKSDWIAIVKANELGIWTENGGPMRWGAMIDLRSAQEKILYFSENCVQPQP